MLIYFTTTNPHFLHHTHTIKHHLSHLCSFRHTIPFPGQHHKWVYGLRQVILLTLTLLSHLWKERDELWGSLHVWKSSQFHRCHRSTFKAWKTPQVWKTYASEKQLLKAVNMWFPFHLRKTLTLWILTLRNDSMHQLMSHCWTTPSNTSFRCSC